MKRIAWTLCLLVASLTGASAQDMDEQYGKDLLARGTLAPEFVIDFKDTTRNIPLSRFRGRYVVLNFWASWCPDCRKEMPAVKALWQKYHNRGVTFIGVSFDTDRDAWIKYIKENDLHWLHYSELKKWKKDSKIDRDYHVNWIPTLYLIDREGKVDLATVMVDKLERRLAELSDSLEESRSLDFSNEGRIPPQYPGGSRALTAFLQSNLQYPEEARRLGAEGRVTIAFIVEKDGSLTNITAPRCEITKYNEQLFSRYGTEEQQKLKQSCMLAMAKEAARVIRKMPKWAPGKENGKSMRVKARQTVNFKLP